MPRVVPDAPPTAPTLPPGVGTGPQMPQSHEQLYGDSGYPPPRQPNGRVGHDFAQWVPDAPPPPVALWGSTTSTSVRQVSPGSTVHDSIMPCVFGRARIEGRSSYISIPDGSNYSVISYFMCWGEQGSLEDIKVGNKDIDDISWIVSYATRLGAVTQTKPSIITRESTTRPGQVDVTIRIDRTTSQQVPSPLSVSMIATGQKIVDFRTGGAAAVNTNPVCIAYHLLTDSEQWLGIDSARIDTDSFAAVADWCDEDVDGEPRWSWQGVLEYRDTRAALVEVLGSCFASLYLGPDRKLRLWAEMPSPAISGTWTAADSATLTGTGGDAVNELTAGRYVLAGVTLAMVLSVSGADEVVLDRQVTCTDARVRPISTVYLKRHNIVSVQGGNEVAKNEIPDVITVRYTDPVTFATVPEACERPEGYDPAGVKRTETTVRGCQSASQAQRYGQQSRLQVELQPYSWAFHADSTAAALEPGDVFLFDDDGVLVEQLARVLPPITERSDGTFTFNAREFDIQSYSDATSAEDTPPSTTGEDPWPTTPPDPPTSVNQAFVTGGDWAAHNLVPDEDDLTGWTATPGFASVSFDGTKSTVTALVDGTAKLVEYTIPSLVGIDSILVTFVARTSIANPGTATDFMVQYAEAAPAGRVEVENNGTTLQRYVMILSATAYATPKLSIWAGYVEAGDSIEIQEFYAIPWSFRPSLSLLERWTWTEGASAATTVDRYELVRVFASGETQLLASAPVGSVLLQAATYSGGALWGGSSWNQLTGSVVRLRVVGRSGEVVYVDADTQSVSALILGDVSGDLRDYDTTARADDTFPVYKASSEKHEYVALSTLAAASHTHDDRYYTETEADTLLGGKVSDTGDTMSGNLLFENNIGVQLKETPGSGGTPRTGMRMTTANAISVGSVDNGLRLVGSESKGRYNGSEIALVSDLASYLPLAGGALSGNLDLANSIYVRSLYSGVYYSILGIAATGGVQVGNGSRPMRLAGSESNPYYNSNAIAMQSELASYAPLSQWSAKGALVTATAASTLSTLAAGTNSYVLMPDSAQANGLKWAQVATASIANDAVTYAKIQNVSAGYLLGRAYGGAAGDCSELATTDLTKIGTGGYTGISATHYYAAVASGGFTIIGRYTNTYINGWMTASSLSLSA